MSRTFIGRDHVVHVRLPTGSGNARGPLAPPPSGPTDHSVEPVVFEATERDTTAEGGTPSGEPPAPQRTEEVASLRTRTSKTYEMSDGSRQSLISSGSLHHREAGTWKPIDNTLVESDDAGFALENSSNRYAVKLPQSLADPIVVDLPGAAIEIVLEEGGGSLTQSANDSATYDEVFSGVDITYQVLSDAIKEEITLDSPDVRASFTYEITMPEALADRFDAVPNGGGGLIFTGPSGHELFRLAAPFAYEQAAGPGVADGPATMSFAKTKTGGSLTIAADQAWLQDSARRFPVVIDPTTLMAIKDCNINSAEPDTPSCDGTQLRVGYNGDSKRRALVKFDTSPIPQSAQVLTAKMSLFAEGSSGSGALAIEARPLKTTWTEDVVTWNNRHQNTPWENAGGDYFASKGYLQRGIDQTGLRYSWYVTKVAQGWTNLDRDNVGLLLKSANETTNRAMFFSSNVATDSRRPYLRVTYDLAGLGERDMYNFSERRLNDRTSVRVNVGSGNALVRADDVTIQGMGMPLELTRYYNSRRHGLTDSDIGMFGPGWTLSTGLDARLAVYDEATVVVRMPSGYWAPFSRSAPDEPFEHPAALFADLKKTQTGYELNNHKSHRTLVFTSDGYLSKMTDANGNTITLGYSGDLLVSVSDTRGRVTSFDYNDSDYVESIEDSAGRIHSYGYGSGGLRTYTDPGGNTTNYTYNDGDLNQIWTEESRGMQIIYDDDHRVTSLRVITNSSNGAADTTRFSYQANSTTVTDARDNPTTYRVFDSAQAGAVPQHRELGTVNKTTDAAGNKFPSAVDEDANVVSYGIEASGAKTGSATYFQGTGDLKSATIPTGATTTIASYEDHMPLSVKDAQGSRCDYDYDSDHNLVQTSCGVTDTSNGVAFDYTYFANGNLEKITDGNRHVTRYEYNIRGELTRVIPPAPLGETEYTYDSLSRVRSVTDGESQTVTYTYDALDRVTSATATGGPSVTLRQGRQPRLQERFERNHDHRLRHQGPHPREGRRGWDDVEL